MGVIMAIRDIFKLSRKTFFDPASWLDVESLKRQNVLIFGVLKNLFRTPAPVQAETFEQACKRLNLSEADIQDMIKSYRLYALLMFTVGMVVLGYTFYLLIQHQTFTGALLGLAATALFLSYAFRYDFWAFQLRTRRLGATFEEWKQHFFASKR